jgi:drug/metabolite transporter (DMT)-like permease
LDNTLSRGLADRDPGQVVLSKATLGAAGSVALALLFREHLPPWSSLIGLLVVGATGYGLSLRFYLLAQRAFGAARTGSMFAFAPFIGAAIAIALGDKTGGWGTAIGALLMMVGVVVHLAESHSHEHEHAMLEHEHSHTHDDGHHNHVHDSMPVGPHSHPHMHKPTRHNHAHVPDLHHMHSH